MGADPRQRFALVEASVEALISEVAALNLRVQELERILLAITRSNAGKDLKRVGT